MQGRMKEDRRLRKTYDRLKAIIRRGRKAKTTVNLPREFALLCLLCIRKHFPNIFSEHLFRIWLATKPHVMMVALNIYSATGRPSVPKPRTIKPNALVPR